MDSAAIVDDIRPLKDAVEIKEGFLIWPLILLVLLFVAGILAFIYFKRKRHIAEGSGEPPRPPEEIAMERLNALLKMGLTEKGMIKEYYIRLSDIMRSFIGDRYRIFALDMTTWELYCRMRKDRIQRTCVDKIRDFLEDCDLVKFAKYIPTQGEIKDLYDRAKEIISTRKLNVSDYTD